MNITLPENQRLGQTGMNNRGTKMKIVEYNTNADILVQFIDNFMYKTRSTYKNFILGYIKNPYDVTAGENGYIGAGPYKIKENRKSYNTWRGIHSRVGNFDGFHPTYEKVTVCEEWYNYQNFAKWYEENYYVVEGDIMCLDKDIIKPYNKNYSPENCCFVPNRLNEIFHDLEKIKKCGLPVGIEHVNRTTKADGYRVKVTYVNNIGERKYIRKTFDDLDEAKKFYSKFKQDDTRRILEEYKDKIPEYIFNAIYNYDFKY